MSNDPQLEAIYENIMAPYLDNGKSVDLQLKKLNGNLTNLLTTLEILKHLFAQMPNGTQFTNKLQSYSDTVKQIADSADSHFMRYFAKK